MVERQLWRLGWAHRGLPIEAVLKDGVDRAVRSGADLEAAAARRLEPLDTVLAGPPQDAPGGAGALVGVRSGAGGGPDHSGGIAAGGGVPARGAAVGRPC